MVSNNPHVFQCYYYIHLLQETESWQFDVENYKTLKLLPEVIAKQKADGAFAVRFDVSSKEGQSTAFDFGGGKGGNSFGSIDFLLFGEDSCGNADAGGGT